MNTQLPIATMPATDAAAEARSVLDLAGLDALKTASAAAPTDPKTLRAVAQQFESLFIGMMLKSMRDAKLGDGLFDSDQSRFYQDLFDQQLSQSLSQGRGLGIADLLVRSLAPHALATTLPEGAYGKLTRRAPTPSIAAAIAAAGGNATEAPPAEAVAPAGGAPGGPAPEGALAATPEEFVALVMPSATAAASALGVDPLALVAQAALESNWGRQVPGAEEGTSYNLFGIKADATWTGRRVLKETLEYTGGVAERRREPFRAYDSIAHGFEDYVSFLQGHERYQPALQQGSDPERFAAALQTAGYATDPAYSTKIAAVMRSSQFRGAVTALKELPEPPIF
ncbi:MAG TPA: flagellar assembly peptidoglycan hydrolase FlgJ [Steroidobacteraceae bacterium]|nr:flagellar assembly peptidoglycan hydrolase FlgJ [Steroidobacteraceae bacterium]